MGKTTKNSIAESEAYVKNGVSGGVSGAFVVNNLPGRTEQERINKLNTFIIAATAKHAPNDGKPGLNTQEQQYVRNVAAQIGARPEDVAKAYQFGKSQSGLEDNIAAGNVLKYANTQPILSNNCLLKAANEQQAPLNVAALAESELRASASVANQPANSQSTGNSLS